MFLEFELGLSTVQPLQQTAMANSSQQGLVVLLRQPILSLTGNISKSPIFAVETQTVNFRDTGFFSGIIVAGLMQILILNQNLV